MTRWLTPFFQSDLTWLGPVRDHALSLAAEVPWVRRQMVAAMSGTSRGPFLERLALPGGWTPPPAPTLPSN